MIQTARISAEDKAPVEHGLFLIMSMISWRFFRTIVICIFLCAVCSSCASVPAVQRRLRRLAAAGDFDRAVEVLARLPEGSYGKNNQLLEALDRGMILHYAGWYRESIAAFETAKRVYDELYTRSLSKIAASWLWNDAALPYPGEDFERAMINAFQALNFAAIQDYNEALVEARNVQSVLQRINDRYQAGQKNVYQDDAFVRMLTGILYESTGQRLDLNDAFVSYKKAVAGYEGHFQDDYSLNAPDVLLENCLSLAGWMGRRDLDFYQRQFLDKTYVSLAERASRAEIYIIYYHGQIVNKVQGTIVLPGMDGLLTRISFPKYRKAFQPEREIHVRAVSPEGQEKEIILQKAQDLDAIARQNLENRRLRILAKAVARPLTKQILAGAAEDVVRDKKGQTVGDLTYYAANVYLLYSEEADLRAWETLPSVISIGRLILEPGAYDFFAGKEKIASLAVSEGDKKFIMHWAAY